MQLFSADVQYFQKDILENKEMVLKNGVKSIQTAAYNDPRTVYQKYKSLLTCWLVIPKSLKISKFSPNTINFKQKCKYVHS